MTQSRLPWCVYRFNGNILTGITAKRYARVARLVQKPWVQPIRRLLAAKGWTQADLAEHAKLRPNTLSEAMNGRSPRMETLEHIAQAFGVPLYELFVSDEQSTLLRHAAHNHQQLVKQEELATMVIRQLGPVVAKLVADATTGQSAPQQAIDHNSATPHIPPADGLARGRLQRGKRSA